MKILLTLLALTFTLTADAQVAIYKNAVTVTETGGGSITKSKMNGWTIIDVQTKRVVRVELKFETKDFWVRQVAYLVTKVLGPNKEFTVFSYADAYKDSFDNTVNDSEYAKGQNFLTDIGIFSALKTPPKFNVPKTMAFSGRTVYTRKDGILSTQENAGNLILDLAFTKSSNFPVNTM